MPMTLYIAVFVVVASRTISAFRAIRAFSRKVVCDRKISASELSEPSAQGPRDSSLTVYSNDSLYSCL